MFKFFAMSVLALALSACASNPTASQVVAIKNACVADSAVRPVVVGIMAAGIATPEEIVAVKAAEVVIDQVCANPEQSAQNNLLTVLSKNAGQVVALVAKYSGELPAESK